MIFPILVSWGMNSPKDGSRLGTRLKQVELELGLGFLLKRNKTKPKHTHTVFLVIRIGQILLREPKIPDSLISLSHQVQFRLTNCPLCCSASIWIMGRLTRCSLFFYFISTFQRRWFIELFCRILSVTHTPVGCSIFFDNFRLFFLIAANSKPWYFHTD